MPPTAKAPPTWLLHGIGRVRNALTVATELQVADALIDGPLTSDEVARRVCADPGATRRSEYADLLSRAGFRHTPVIPTTGPMSIVEAVPA